MNKETLSPYLSGPMVGVYLVFIASVFKEIFAWWVKRSDNRLAISKDLREAHKEEREDLQESRDERDALKEDLKISRAEANEWRGKYWKSESDKIEAMKSQIIIKGTPEQIQTYKDQISTYTDTVIDPLPIGYKTEE